jgi:DNA repair photolyase
LVDIAASNELATETAEMVQVLLNDTDWDVRLLSKSPLIKLIAQSLTDEQKRRVIFGLSIGTLDDELARAIEPTCPSPSRRCDAHRWLQDQGYRTFAMLCPILPQSLDQFVRKAVETIRPDQCEHVWAEVLNVRGESMTQTLASLENSHLHKAAEDLRAICGQEKRHAWEDYARETFLALTQAVPKREDGPKLRFLQYVTRESDAWWRACANQGAVLLGKFGNQQTGLAQPHEVSDSTSSTRTIPKAPAALPSQQMSSLLEEAAMLSKAAADAAGSAVAAAEKSANILARLVTLAKTADPSVPDGSTGHQKKAPDPKRSEAAKRAWVTIRNKKALPAPPLFNPK